MFLVQVGWESWPSVYQYVQLFTLSFIILTNFINLKKFYKFHYCILIGLLLSISMFQQLSSAALAITAVAVMVMAMDLIGEITSTNALMKIIDSLRYKKLSPKIVIYSTSANILGTVSVILVQRLGNHTVFAIILAVFVSLHMAMFHKMTKQALKLSGNKKKMYEEKVSDKLKDTVKYTLKNRLVIMACALIIWSQIAKFFCDWIYLTSANIIFPTENEMTTFIGVANLALMAGVICFQKLISPHITSRFSPATLLSFVPIMFLIFSLAGQIFQSPFIGISINVLFLILFRALHMPTLKVCMQSIDAGVKPKVFLLLNFFISIFLLTVTTGIKFAKDYFSIELIYVALIFMAIVAILIIMRFDGHYLRNLWKNVFLQDPYHDWNERVQFSDTEDEDLDEYYFNPHHYFVEPYHKYLSIEVKEFVDRIKLFPKENASKEFIDVFYAKERTPFEKMILIINNFVYSKNLNMFQEAVVGHKHMFQSDNSEVVEKAYHLFNLIGIPVFSKLIQEGIQSTNAMVKKFSTKAFTINDFINDLNPQNTIYHKRLKLFILLNWEYLSPDNQKKLKLLISKPHSPIVADLVSWLGSRKINTTKHDLLKSFDVYKMKFDFKEFIERYLSHSHEKRVEMQEILLSIKCPDQSRQELESVLTRYPKDISNEASLDEILDILFLVEWIHIKEDGYRYALTSVQGYKHLRKGDGEYWKDFHMELLKKLGLYQFYDLIDKRL